MKKNYYLLFILSLCFVGCADKSSYKITGTAPNSLDGDSVVIQEIRGRELIELDKAVIKNQKFSFTGKQDSTVIRYISYGNSPNPVLTDFFLENGNIHIELSQISSVKGTPNNNAYQKFKDKIVRINEEQQEIYESYQDPLLTEEDRENKLIQIQEKDKAIAKTIEESIEENIDNPVGIHLLTNYNFLMSYEDLGELLKRIPEKYKNEPIIVKLIEEVTINENLAIGKPFTDLEMNDPTGNPIKLSEFIPKNQYTLIDFWASWCGPCLREMPELKELYANYHKAGFEIIGVSLDRDQEAWTKGIENLNITWPQMSDLKMWESDAVKFYSIRSIPYTVLVDKEGTILAKGLRSAELKEKLAELFD